MIQTKRDITLEKKRVYWEKRCKEEIKDKNDLQKAYNIAMEEINRLRKKLGYDKKQKYGRTYS